MAVGSHAHRFGSGRTTGRHILGPKAEAAVVKRALAPVLLGRDPSADRQAVGGHVPRDQLQRMGRAEMRAISAVDMALWDFAGKAAACRFISFSAARRGDAIRTYNTCYDHLDFID